MLRQSYLAEDMTDTQVSNVASRAAADAATVAADDTAVIPLAEDAAVVEQAVRRDERYGDAGVANHILARLL
jgi:hypothetical protein